LSGEWRIAGKELKPVPFTSKSGLDGDQLVAVLNSAGAITHETFDGPSLDQVFADQTTLSGVLWPLEDRTGSVRDVVNSAGVSQDHRKLNRFGAITSQTGATVDYDQFFSGLAWDADSQLYYARARWYDPTVLDIVATSVTVFC